MQHITFSSSQLFQDGYQMGQECALDIRESGIVLTTDQDTWTFLHSEASPQAIQRDERADKRLGTSPVSPAQRAGFLAGYLATMFTEQA